MNGAQLGEYVPRIPQATGTERELVASAQAGDLDAFGELFEIHKNAVYRFVLGYAGSREDAEDVVQEAFCRAWSSISRFRGDSSFLTWVFKIAVTLCSDRARAAKRRSKLLAEAPRDLTDESVRFDHDCGERQETRQAVAQAIRDLPDSHRQIVILCDVQGFTSTEAARILGCSAISVRVRLSRAREKLRQALSAEDGKL